MYSTPYGDSGNDTCDKIIDGKGELHSICANTLPAFFGKWKCECKEGWESLAGKEKGTSTCIDIDKCARGTHNCIPVMEGCAN
jgi:hypothetical protein